MTLSDEGGAWKTCAALDTLTAYCFSMSRHFDTERQKILLVGASSVTAAGCNIVKVDSGVDFLSFVRSVLCSWIFSSLSLTLVLFLLFFFYIFCCL